MTNTLTFFPVTGNYQAVADPSISGVLNSPVVQPVNALVTFTPRLKKGQLFYVSDYLVTNAYNALQTVYLLGEPIGGTWTYQFGTDITTPLPWSITPSAFQTALEALPSIGAGNVIVTADVEPTAFDIEFTNSLGLQRVPVGIGNADLLTNARGAGFCEITVAPTAMGSPQITADTAIALSPITARIFDGVLSTIDRVDTPGIELVANSAAMNQESDLIYDVTFSQVTYNGDTRSLAPFAFIAPIDNTPVCMTNPEFEVIPYTAPNQPPYTTLWSPPAGALDSGTPLLEIA